MKMLIFQKQLVHHASGLATKEKRRNLKFIFLMELLRRVVLLYVIAMTMFVERMGYMTLPSARILLVVWILTLGLLRMMPRSLS